MQHDPRSGRAARGRADPCELRCLDQVDAACLACQERDVVLGRHRQRQDALVDVLEIDARRPRHYRSGRCDRHHRHGLLFDLWPLGRGLRRGCVLLIALRREGGFLLGRQDDEVDIARRGPIQRRHERAARRADVRGRGEVEVLPRAVELRGRGIAHAVGDTVRLAGGQRVEVDREEMAVHLLGEAEPLAVRRPGGRLDFRVVEILVGVDLRRLAGRDIRHPPVELLVGVGDLLAIRRPRGAVEERRSVAGLDLLRRALAVLRLDVEHVFA